MGKSNRRKVASSSSKRQKAPSKFSKPQGITKSHAAANKSSNPPPPKHKQPSQNKPTIPFRPHERILLIGEGDLSFAASLVTNHHCTNLTATTYEPRGELVQKYPHVEENVGIVGAGGGTVKYGVDVTKMKPWVEGRRGDERGVWDRIMFNFPHVGGKTKDVNRQVRFNQELLVSFFKTALPSLAPRRASSIVVTLFEGEPYTLWNIRDLARHAGLAVEQSFVFQSSAYPGYRHARTLGVVKGRDGKESGGAWKGEERKARSYVFVRRGEEPKPGVGRAKQESDSEEDTDDGEGEEWGSDIDEEMEDDVDVDQKSNDNSDEG